MQPLLPHAVPVVLDTNVVLDWQVFQDRRAAPLARSLALGQMRWHATSAMLCELRAVLARPLSRCWEGRREHALTSDLSLWAATVETTAGPAPGLTCRDPDDQKFLDLALSLRAPWLVTRDRALLELARKAAPRGLAIVTPEGWATMSAARGP
ncbi:MAG: putative toxin-antitoxin system toxin component, PIN family [Rubrivivax sp.]|nr:putative toxin-antitoxin system toxin component, PIN family [Rubrivivax sp.]